MRTVSGLAAAAIALASCKSSPQACAAGQVASTSQPGACCADGTVPRVSAACAAPGCTAIAVSGDAPATTLGNFKGFADPSLRRDPAAAGRLWLAYSWPSVTTAQTPTGQTVNVGVVRSHLARSDDGGATFSFVGVLYDAPPVVDPEGSGEAGFAPSETVSLAALAGAGGTTWYAAHLRYFLETIAGYNPKYATSWTVRIGAAPSPDLLGDGAALAKEVVIGVSTTAAVYAPSVRVDELAGLPIQYCAILNNPSLFARDGTLYLTVECLAFVGKTPDFAHSTLQTLAATPSGDPQTWSWRHVGTLADHALAEQLGADTIQQPEVAEAEDGTLLLLLTPAHADPTATTGAVPDGCAALELASMDPPALRRDCAGKAVVRGRLTGTGVGSCAYDAASTTGVLATTLQASGPRFVLDASGMKL